MFNINTILKPSSGRIFIQKAIKAAYQMLHIVQAIHRKGNINVH